MDRRATGSGPAVVTAALVLGTVVAAGSCTRGGGRPSPGTPAPAAAGEPKRAPGLATSLVPYPARLTGGRGEHVFDGALLVVPGNSADAELGALAGHAARTLAESLGLPARAVAAGSPDSAAPTRRAAATGSHGAFGQVGRILLAIDPALPDTSPEAYRLVTDETGVTITARGHAGLFYGVQTLRQLVYRGDEGWAVPAVQIADRPRFAYRGLHLDVARHFFSVEFVKRIIDLLARHKLNTFHWHLTDDQGWRIEIRRYPRLTAVGAHRSETVVDRRLDPYVGDGVPHGGFYTQEEIREVVAYAAERYVTVLPEIEMPGHAVAALAAYPELACTPGPFEVGTTWGVYEDVLCPSERTFDFLERVLAEVIELFPGPYVHVGGDEVPKHRWRESEIAQEVMRREGLASEEALQGYFIGRIGAFLRRHGRRLIGWDEILEGGPPPGAIVMAWRGMAAGIEAARAGHDVIMTPTSHLYFDRYQGDPETEPLAFGGYTPLERVYGFEPVPEELTAEEVRRVLGAQGNVWTEYMKTEERVEYMLFPRLLALAEAAWSPREARDWASFRARLPARLAALDSLGVRYRIPDVEGLDGDRLALDSTITLTLISPLPTATIRYTTDGSEPGPGSPRYTGPLELQVREELPVRARLLLPDGRAGPIASARVRPATLRAAEDLDPALSAGIEVAYYEGEFDSVSRLADAVPAATGVAREVALQGGEREERFGLRFAGFLRVPTDGIYRFTLRSDDGSALAIGDEVVVDHDGLHGPTDASGPVALAKGLHPIVVGYFQAGGGKELRLLVTRPGSRHEPPTPVPAEWLYHLTLPTNTTLPTRPFP